MSSQTSHYHQRQPDRGWGILEHGSIALFTVIVICIVGALVWGSLAKSLLRWKPQISRPL
ncbi:type IV prepilin [Enterobacter cloacae]|jgi:hypothetical protein|uniref:Type IV prepilin n=1 Tax=Enterobacter cloacae TaxID=550 RepID=A0A377MA87_ENTCL|nr:type IV prepilin [Enterobacter cloacae]